MISLIKYGAYVLTGLVLLSLLLTIKMPTVSAFQIVLGSFYALFLPGFVLSWILFKPGRIDIIERIALSFGLSIAVVPLVAFYLNMVGVKINLINISLTILAIILAALGILYLKGRKGVKS